MAQNPRQLKVCFIVILYNNFVISLYHYIISFTYHITQNYISNTFNILYYNDYLNLTVAI